MRKTLTMSARRGGGGQGMVSSCNRRFLAPPAFAVDCLLELLRKDVLAARIAMLPFGVRNDHRGAGDVRWQLHLIIAALLLQAQLAANRAFFAFHILSLMIGMGGNKQHGFVRGLQVAQGNFEIEKCTTDTVLHFESRRFCMVPAQADFLDWLAG